MKDPWRPTDAIEPEPIVPGPRTKKVNLGADLDDDLRIEAVFRFSSRGGTVKVANVDVTSPSAALHLLVACLFDLWSTKTLEEAFKEAQVSVRFETRDFGVRFLVDDSATIFTTDPGFEPYAQLRLVNQEYSDGMIRLLRLLKAAERRYPKILEKWGVVPMLR